jgi:signal transduction histidine kinase
LNRLKSIINSLLLISKVENNQFNKNDIVKIPEIITEINEELEDRLEDKDITLTNNIKYEQALIGNRSLMHTLLFNLVNNAIKYNYKGGNISINDEVVNGLYLLEIKDTGVGMDNAQIEKAFTRFEKLDTDERESYGLGLAIVKSIAAFHKIEISVVSEKNKGTLIKLKFNERR